MSALIAFDHQLKHTITAVEEKLNLSLDFYGKKGVSLPQCQ
ncbi:hypothetical protein [Shewanella denitrificans]|nr:hypothetical protein [Shewanella denitrificans]